MKDRVAFVTGASQGIGRECALTLAREGAKVALGARQLDKLEALAAEIREAGGVAFPVELDVSSADSIQAAFAAAAKELGPIEILVNNAGITRDGLAMRMSRENWDQVLDTNLTGAFLCIQAVLRGMAKARWGRIINISSVTGQAGNPGQANYAAAKAGMIGMTKSLALELAARNITVNAVAPGFIETAMTEALDEKAQTALLDRIPLGRVGSTAEIAAAVKYLASDEAGYTTGQTLAVNGGLYL